MKYVAIVLALPLLACEARVETRSTESDVYTISRIGTYHDVENNVMCYSRGYNSLSCVRID